MKYPYGISDFGKIIQEDYCYIDRTGAIPLIEDMGQQLLFLRPRRFGKSLLLSMLEHYYDLARAAAFDQTFGRLVIGKAPTQRHSQYFILRWDFSMVVSQGNLKDLKKALYSHINGAIQACAGRYSSYLQNAVTLDEDAIASFSSLLSAVEQSDHKLYLFIDEYDNFANEIAMGSRQGSTKHYEDLLRGEGLLKSLFKAVKAGASGRGLDRVFITGVSPMALSDLTSGYNVAKSISLEPELEALCGFTEAEVKNTLDQMQQSAENELPPAEECLELMRTFYNGYRFSELTETLVYNPTLVLYFLEYVYRHHCYPSNMLDENLAMDRGKLAYIAALPKGPELIETAIEQKEPLIVDTLLQRFGIHDLLYGQKDQAFMLSLLYFFGVLTLKGKDPFGALTLIVPNQAIFRLYLEQLRTSLLPRWDVAEDRTCILELCSKGNIEPVCASIEQKILPAFSNRDYAQANELTLKTAFLLLLFNDRLYQLASERRVGRGYADLSLLLRPDARQYPLLDLLIEFKYINLKHLGLSGEAVRQLSLTECEQLKVVKQAEVQAKEQLQRYAKDLQGEFDHRLNLRTYTVVALGFERLIGREIDASLEQGKSILSGTF